MREKVIGIYKITNKINGNCYIGQSVDIKTRWRKHKEYSLNKTSKAYEYPLMRAFRKHGVENFSFDIVERLSSNKKLLELEIKWYKMLNPEYNQEFPESCKAMLKKPIYKIDIKTFKILKKYDGIADGAKDVGVHPSGVTRAYQGARAISGGYYWCLVNDYYDGWKPKRVMSVSKTKKTIRKFNPKAQPIYRINLNTLEKVIYKNISDGTKSTNINGGSIFNACNGKCNTAGGYYWTYVDEYDKWKGKKIIPINPDDAVVYKIDIGTLKIVGEYRSIYIASKKNGINSELIRNVCSNKSSFSSGYYWCLKKDYKNWKPKRDTGSPIVFFRNGTMQKIFDSVIDAKRELKYNRKSIALSCDTGHISRKGYSFKYLEDYEKENGLESRYSDI